MTIEIQEMSDSEYSFRVVNTRSGYEDKAYSLKEALRLANNMFAQEISRKSLHQRNSKP